MFGAANFSPRCLTCQCAAIIEKDDAQAHAFEVAARKEMQKHTTQWAKFCGHGGLFEWWDPTQGIAALEDLRGDLTRRKIVKNRAEDLAKTMAVVKVRRERMLASQRALSKKRRAMEEDIRMVDPDFRALSEKRSNPTNKDERSGTHLGAEVKMQHKGTSPSLPDIDNAASGSELNRAMSAKAIPHRPQSATTTRVLRIDAVLQPSRPSSVAAHFRLLEKPQDDWRATKLDTPEVIVTPRPCDATVPCCPPRARPSSARPVLSRR